MAELLGGLEWTRPHGLAALLLPLLVWLLARRRGRPRAVPIGTFALWKEGPRGAPGARRRRVPPATWLVIAALFLGALALGGPRRRPDARSAEWRVMVDRSPSMYLAHDARNGARGTRLDEALARLARLADERGARVVEWLASRSEGPDERERASGSAPPQDWRAPPRAPRRAPRWPRFDAPDTLWLTDKVPAYEPRLAGVVASGGAAVPGPVAARGDVLLEWDGSELVERPGAAPEPVVALEGSVPGPIADLVRAWAQERGARVAGSDAPEPVALRVAAPTDPAGAETVALERDGWSGLGRAVSLASDIGGDVWLAAPDGRPLVRVRAGRVDLALVELEEPQGDPALFAVSWSSLLDALVLPPPGVVELAERRAAGPSLSRAPRSAPAHDAEEAFPLAARLSALASLCAALALVAAARST